MMVSAPTTRVHPFCTTASDHSLFCVAGGVPLVDALIQASEYLKGALAANVEVGENIPVSMAALSRMVGHSIEMAQALVEASIGGLEYPRIDEPLLCDASI